MCKLCTLSIQRTHHALAALVQHVGVNHRGGNIGMPKQLLYGANIVAGLQQMRGEGMAPMPMSA